jgi:ferredoxin
MAFIVINGVEQSIPDGSALAPVCKRAGLVFSCNTGVCGSCQIRILEGSTQVTALTDEEKDLGLDSTNRLACQCAITGGRVVIAF